MCVCVCGGGGGGACVCILKFNIESQFDLSVFDSLLPQPISEELAEVPTLVEICRATSRLANNKASGKSDILLEMVKNAGATFFNNLLILLHRVWMKYVCRSPGVILN